MEVRVSAEFETELCDGHQDGKDQATEQDHEDTANVDHVQGGGLRSVSVGFRTPFGSMLPPFVVDHLKQQVTVPVNPSGDNQVMISQTPKKNNQFRGLYFADLNRAFLL